MTSKHLHGSFPAVMLRVHALMGIIFRRYYKFEESMDFFDKSKLFLYDYSQK